MCSSVKVKGVVDCDTEFTENHREKMDKRGKVLMFSSVQVLKQKECLLKHKHVST